MYFILSKTLDFILMPMMWILALAVYALWLKNPKKKRKVLKINLILLLFLSNPFIINELLLFWEKAPTKMEALKDNYDIGIVLTGTTNSYKSPKDRVYLSKGADRIMHALMLYRKGKIKKILITGGTVNIFGNKQVSEAKQLARILADCQVPEEDIILEEQARNTRENALYTKKILKAQFPNQKYLLISSAFHMPRALACFKKQGVKVKAFSADFYTVDRQKALSIIPSEQALYKWYVLIHEILGYFIYKILGYS